MNLCADLHGDRHSEQRRGREDPAARINKIGNLVKPLLLGDLGEAAVISFDSRVRVMQDFTSDPDKITASVRKIYAGGMFAHLNDAVDESIRMLRSRGSVRGGNRRLILLLISETRDQGSAATARETLIELNGAASRSTR